MSAAEQAEIDCLAGFYAPGEHDIAAYEAAWNAAFFRKVNARRQASGQKELL